MVFHSMFEYSYLMLPVAGFTIGFFSSVVGSGGGFFFLPLLILLYGVPAQVAVATSLAASLPVCLVGTAVHYRNSHINFPLAGVFAVAGILGAIAGAAFSGMVSSQQLKTGFGIYTLFIALQILFNDWKMKKIASPEIVDTPIPGRKKYIDGSLYGFLAGLVTGTFGTSGAAPVLAGLLSMRIPLKIVAGTSLLIITVTTISALGAHFIMGEIDLTLVYFLTSGAVIGAFTGPRFLAGIKTDKAERPVRRWYAAGLMVFGILLMVSR